MEKTRLHKIPRWLQIAIVVLVIIFAAILVLKYGGWFDKVAAVYVAQGDAALSERDYSQAMERYAYALTLKHLDGNVAYEAYLKRGQIFMAKRDFESAQAEFTSASKLRRRRPEAYFRLGQSGQALYEYEDAIANLEKAVKYDSQEPEYLLELSKAIFRSGKELSRAEDLLNQVINLSPDSQGTYFYKALLVMESSPDEARELIAEALDLSGPFVSRAQSAHARILDYQNRISERSDEREAQSYRKVLVGWTYAGVNEPMAAQRMAEQALEMTPDYRDAWLLKGWSEIETKDFAAAQESLTEAYNLDPTLGQTQYLFALAESCQDKDEAALESFSKALSLGYDHPQLRLDYAKVLEKTGALSAAEEQLRAAYKKDRQNYEIVRDLVWFLGNRDSTKLEALEIAKRFDKEIKTSASESLLALAYLLADDEAEAKKISSRVIEREPSQALAYYVRGIARGDGADLIKAIDVDFDGTVGNWAQKSLDL